MHCIECDTVRFYLPIFNYMQFRFYICRKRIKAKFVSISNYINLYFKRRGGKPITSGGLVSLFSNRMMTLQVYYLSHSRWIIINTITKMRLFKYIENFTSKNWKFSDKNCDIFQISAQNIDCGYSLEPSRRDDSNEYPQSMFLSSYKKNNVYPCKPQFYYIKVGFKGVILI